jgi:hypothetical protein
LVLNEFDGLSFFEMLLPSTCAFIPPLAPPFSKLGGMIFTISFWLRCWSHLALPLISWVASRQVSGNFSYFCFFNNQMEKILPFYVLRW